MTGKTPESAPAKTPAAHTRFESNIPGVDPVAQWICPHGNHLCLACEDCGRIDPRNGDEGAANSPRVAIDAGLALDAPHPLRP